MTVPLADSGRKMPWFYYATQLGVRSLLVLLSRWQVKGKDNIPRQGPLLVVANHLHLADPPILSVSLVRPARFMAKEELFHPGVFGYFLRGVGVFPVRRGQLDRQALRQAQQVLADGLALVIFPEATRSRQARLQPAFSGAALIAVRNGVPILPIGITGTEKFRGLAWLLRRPRITVNIGHPFSLPPRNGKLSKTELAELTKFIMGRIAELLPVEYQGEYAAEVN